MTLSDLGSEFCVFEYAQTVDADFGTLDQYVYMDAENSATGKAGWFLDDYETPADDVVVPAGTGILFEAAGTSKIQTSGAVSKDDIIVKTGDFGISIIANGTPVAITLGQLGLEGAGTFDGIQTITVDGATKDQYVYMAKEDSPTGVAGWFCDDYETSADDVEIAPGTGFLYDAQNGVVTITIPSPLKK